MEIIIDLNIKKFDDTEADFVIFRTIHGFTGMEKQDDNSLIIYTRFEKYKLKNFDDLIFDFSFRAYSKEDPSISFEGML